MAEANAYEVLNGADTSQEEKTPDENIAPPTEAENAEHAADGITPGEQPEQSESEAPQTEQPQSETPGQEQESDTPSLDNPEAPEVADGDSPLPSNVIDGQFGDKRAAAKDAEQDNGEKDTPVPKRRGRQPKEDKTTQAEKTDKAKTEKPKRGEKAPKENKAASVGGGGIGGTSGPTTTKELTPQEKTAAMAEAAIAKANEPSIPEPLKDARRPGGKETIIYINHAELHPFKNHPFQVRDDDAMKSLVASVKERGFDQAAIVRPREDGGFEIVAGHRRQQASIMAGLKNLPCVVRNMTDEEAILAMTESNFTYRTEILASERAQAFKMQLDAIKRQGERFTGVAAGDIGKRSNEIVAEKNSMGAKTVQRYIALNNLTPDMMKLADDKKISFMAAFEISYIKPKLQEYIAMTVEAQEAAPTHAQAQRMRELDAKGVLKGDVIDGIMLEEKKEDRKVIISGQELDKYFGAEKTPKEMKDTILKLLDEYKEKNPLELGNTDKKKDQLEK